MQRLFKWIGIAIGTPILLVLFLGVLIYLPPVQKWAVHKAETYASQELGMQVSIKKLSLSFPIDLSLSDFIALQNNDTVLAVRELTAEIELVPLFQKHISIDKLSLKGIFVNTLDIIDAASVRGTISDFFLTSHGIGLTKETATINDLFMEGAQLHVSINDSVPEDTVESEPIAWRVLLEKTRIKESNLQLLLDSMEINLGFGDAQLSHASMDLQTNTFMVPRLDLRRSSVSVDLDSYSVAQGFDYNHLCMDSLWLTADSIVNKGSYLSVNLLKGKFHERSGLTVTSTSGQIRLDSLAFHSQNFIFETPYSNAIINSDLDWSSLGENKKGSMDVDLQASIGKNDILLAVGEDLAKEINGIYPDCPLLAQVNIQGNMDKLLINDLQSQLEGVISVEAEGNINNVLSEEKRQGIAKFKASVGDFKPILKLLNINDYTIPRGARIKGLAQVVGSAYKFDGKLEEGNGLMGMKASFDSENSQYEANLQIEEMNIHHFMPKDSLFFASGSIVASGKGTDIFANSTSVQMQVSLSKLQYKKQEINDVSLDAKLIQNAFDIQCKSENSSLLFHAAANGELTKDFVGGCWDVDIEKADLVQLGVFENKSDLALHFEGTGGYDFDEDLFFDAKTNKMSIRTKDKLYKLKDIEVRGDLSHDSICAHLYAGDLKAHVDIGGGLNAILEEGQNFWDILKSQIAERQIQYNVLKDIVPIAHLELKSGRENPIARFLNMKGYGYKSMSAVFDTSRDQGLNGKINLYSFKTDSLQLDTVRFSVFPQGESLGFHAQVHNNRKNPQYVFNALLDGQLNSDSATAHLQFLDQSNVKGVDLGVHMYMKPDGYLLTLSPDVPLIAYHYFNVSPDDAHIFISQDMKISGNLSLKTDDGTSLSFKADPEDDEQQCMRLDLTRINLEEISEVLPYMPRIKGLVSGSLHAHQPLGELLKADGKLSFSDLVYEESPMGDIDIDMEYVPSGIDEHLVSMRMERNGELVSQLSGTYMGSNGNIQLDAQLIRFPAEIINGFIPDHVFGMRGTLEGKFKLSGNSEVPVINGTVVTDSVYLYSDRYNLNLRVQNKEFPIKDSRFTMRDFILYSEKNDELRANGTIDFANLEKILVNLTLQTQNFQLIDRPRNMVSQLYGKAFMNLRTTVRGDLDNLVVRGSVDLLGTTDVTYVLKDSPVTVEDRLNDLVTFVDFSDTTSVQKEIPRKKLSGVDVQLNLNISEGARVNCDLSPNRESYVQLLGGGDLIFRYTPSGEMLLNGRYNINYGEMKYDLQVIPLKTFTLNDGSYVHFNGNIMNPTLNIKATEKTRASVTSGGGSPRNVLFEVGVKISQTLQNMGLEFTIDALEDLTVQNELAAFSKETKSKLAVSMLATGLYLSEENAQGNISMSSALNSFLQSEISSIAGNALKSLDLSFGMEDGTASDGSATTDYSFRFSKHLWGNRVNIVVGGKVSTGANVDASDSFIDDISIEYRLDDSGTRYVKIFHEKTFDSLLDGAITETGGGIVVRKKMTKIGELFLFTSKKKREAIMQQRERRREQRERQRQQTIE